MANIYEWKVEHMSSQKQLDQLTDVVVEVGWSCTVTDGTYFNVIPGLTRINYIGSGEFTPYEQLTQEVILSWVWANITKEEVEAEGDRLINEQVNPPIVNLPLPWAATAIVTPEADSEIITPEADSEIVTPEADSTTVTPEADSEIVIPEVV
jgi:hypothetical protein